jgi:hypothetical protein
LSHLARASVSRVLSWTAIYLGLGSPLGSSGTPCFAIRLCRTRPCTQVGILPFQPDLTGSFLFAPLAPARSARQALPATLLLRLPAVGARTFLPCLATRAAAKRASIIVPQSYRLRQYLAGRQSRPAPQARSARGLWARRTLGNCWALHCVQW